MGGLISVNRNGATLRTAKRLQLTELPPSALSVT